MIKKMTNNIVTFPFGCTFSFLEMVKCKGASEGGVRDGIIHAYIQDCKFEKFDFVEVNVSDGSVVLAQVCYIICATFRQKQKFLFVVKYLTKCTQADAGKTRFNSSIFSMYKWAATDDKRVDPIFLVEIIEETSILRPSFIVPSFSNQSISTRNIKSMAPNHRFFHVTSKFFDRTGWQETTLIEHPIGNNFFNRPNEECSHINLVTSSVLGSAQVKVLTRRTRKRNLEIRDQVTEETKVINISSAISRGRLSWSLHENAIDCQLPSLQEDTIARKEYNTNINLSSNAAEDSDEFEKLDKLEGLDTVTSIDQSICRTSFKPLTVVLEPNSYDCSNLNSESSSESCESDSDYELQVASVLLDSDIRQTQTLSATSHGGSDFFDEYDSYSESESDSDSVY
jgi:hypothetical protein